MGKKTKRETSRGHPAPNLNQPAGRGRAKSSLGPADSVACAISFYRCPVTAERRAKEAEEEGKRSSLTWLLVGLHVWIPELNRRVISR